MATFFAPERLEADGFVIRSYRPGDGPALHEAKMASSEHLRPWMPWASAEEDPDDSEQLARTFRGKYLLNTDFVLGVWPPDERRLLGGTGFHLRGGYVLEDRVAEIGMWIRGDAAGEGLGTKVLEAMIGWGFEEWPWERLSWHCDSRNVASRRTAEKAGMDHEGTLHGDRPDVGEGRCETLIFGLARPQEAPISGR